MLPNLHHTRPLTRVALLGALIFGLLATGCRDEQQMLEHLASEWGTHASTKIVKCHDELDNDGDGLTDCQDSDCQDSCKEGLLEDLTTCMDGVDNDGDGQSDCDDDLCRANEGCCPPQDERRFEDSVEACGDGIDNDCNGYIDCADYDCLAVEGVDFCEGTDEACEDNIDNDGNGYTDCQDYSCSRNSAVTVCSE